MPRLFFALWPGEAAAGKLASLAGELAGRSEGKAVPAGKIHLTLAFLGDVADARAAGLAAVRIEAAPFAMRLDCVGSFRKAGVAWAGVESPAPELLALQSKLVRALETLGFTLEEREYVPHVTLARKIRRPVARMGIEPVEWTVEEVTLVRSDTGKGTYTRVSGWHLRD